MEKNREILQEALNHLPQRKAGPKSWGIIAASLDQLAGSWFMQRNKGGLPTHTAPISAWKGIKQGLQGSGWAGANAFVIKAGSMVILAAALVTAVLVMLPEKEPRSTIESTVIVMDGTEAAEDAENNGMPEINAVPLAPEVDSEDPIGQGVTTPVHEETPEAITTGGKKTSILPQASPSKLKTAHQPQENFSMPASNPIDRINPLTSVRLPVYLPSDPALLSWSHPVKPPADPGYYRQKRGFDLSVGGHYSWIRHKQLHLDNMEVPASVNGFGLDLMLERDRVYLLIGLSYLSWEDKATYTFNYNKNELVYAYQYVDSAAFIPETNQVEYYTSEQEVYDSVFHQRPDAIRNHNRVLQIPLIFGYKLYESRRWLMGLNAGLGADINLSNTVYAPVFDEDQASLAGIDNHLVYRTPVSWRLLGGASIQFRVSNHLGLFFEPAYHIYLNTVYQGTGMNNVSYFEVKFGIRYKF